MSFSQQGAEALAEAPLDGPLVSGSAAPARASLREDDSGHGALLANEHVELYYATGWPQPTILYSIQGRKWGCCVMQEVNFRSLLSLPAVAIACPIREVCLGFLRRAQDQGLKRYHHQDNNTTITIDNFIPFFRKSLAHRLVTQVLDWKPYEGAKPRHGSAPYASACI